MQFSVVIPAYNAASTIAATLDSVLDQSVGPQEILVYDDGSADETPAILERYKTRIKIFRQPNQGVAHARNFLCAQAKGDIIAFLDSDDLWHPRYLETQSTLIAKHPDAVAWFTYHEDLVGPGNYAWRNDGADAPIASEVIGPADFVRRYNETPLTFQMSCCCISQTITKQIGGELFRVTPGEDTYFHNLLPLYGAVVHSSALMVVYRINPSSLSSNRLRMALGVVEALDLLEPCYRARADAPLLEAFHSMQASRQRNCGKYLMAAGREKEARRLFFAAAQNSRRPVSLAKSIGVYCASYLPKRFQPAWPVCERCIP